VALAGNPVGPAKPPSTTSSYTLADIYERLNSGTIASPSTFTEPTAGPETGTMHTLDEIYNLADRRIPAPVAKTGQTTSYVPGDDGDLQEGLGWPDPRFTDNGDGTVTDNLTRLVWLKDANCLGQAAWPDAVALPRTLSTCECGLTDASMAGDWRLPNLREMHSLIDFYPQTQPTLPLGHPFLNVKPVSSYWSSTTALSDSTYAWGVDMTDGDPGIGSKTVKGYIWPVRNAR